MNTFHTIVYVMTREHVNRDKDFISKFVNCQLACKLTDDERESIVEIMEHKLANQ